MQIVFYRHSLLNRGGDKVFLHYANYLASKGHVVSLYVNKVDSLFLIHPNLTLKKIPFPGKIGTIIHATLSKFNADLVVADFIPIANFLSVRNPDLIYFAQDLDLSYYEKTYQKNLVQLFFYFGLKILKIPTISVSNKLAGELRHLSNGTINVVQNGVDTEVFYPDSSNQYKKIKGAKKSVVFMARSDFRKGLDVGDAVFEKLNENHNELFQIWAVGEEYVNDSLDIVNFGYVTADILRQLFSSADLFLYPTRHEGLPLMVLEAMACGCPVVTTAASDEIAADGVNSLVFPIEDVNGLYLGIYSVLTDDMLRKKLRSGGLLTAGEHCLENASAAFERELDSRQTGIT